MAGIIHTKKELEFYLMADSMMNLGYFKRPLKKTIRDMLVPDYTMSFLRAMRRNAYYSHQKGVISSIWGG